MLVNCTESPYQEWTKEMLNNVKETYGMIVNHVLPPIDKNMTDEEIDLIAEDHYDKILTIIDEKSDKTKPDAVFLNESLKMHYRVKYFLEETHIESIDIDDFKEDGDF
ncbi:MAG: hypothetical protein C0598_04705 [Marinilabiliales bacterium]|nr:MAG: hypothetical protein C0598_04705 [Marinilabiliales bacterium]